MNGLLLFIRSAIYELFSQQNTFLNCVELLKYVVIVMLGKIVHNLNQERLWIYLNVLFLK